MENAAQFFFDLIFQPGSSLQLIPAINVTVVLLLGVLIFLTYTKIATIHLVVMGCLSLGLLASVNWFYMEFKRIRAAENDSTTVQSTTTNATRAKCD